MRKEPYRPLILFDFGGTLNSDGDHWGALFRDMLRRLFPDHSVDQLEAAWVASERRLVAEGLSVQGFDETLRKQIGYQFEALQAEGRMNEAVAEAERWYEETSRRMTRVGELFSSLHRRADIGVVSNFYGNIPAVMREFNLEGYLSVVYDSALIGLRKPDPEIWAQAIEAAEGRPESTVVVGDSYRNDIRPAASIGCRTIWYRGLEWRPTEGEGIESAQVTSLEELSEALERIMNELETDR